MHTSFRVFRVERFLMLALVILAGCDGETCLDAEPDLACTPLYEPTFDNLYDHTLAPKCSLNGASCHAAAGDQGGLTLEGRDAAYEALVTDGRVLAGDARCSTFVVRTHSSEDGTQMPPGATLDEAELCSIRQWVAAGAPR